MDHNKNEILKILRVVYSRKRVFALATMLVMSALLVRSYLTPKQYRADSKVFIERNVIDNLVRGLAVTPEMEDRIRVLSHAMLSRELVSSVLDKIDSGPVYGSPAEKQSKIVDLQRRTRIEVQNRGDLFIVSLVDRNPRFAMDFVNTLVRSYVESNISAKREESYGANRFLNEQIDLFKKKLDQSEDAIIQYRRSQGVSLGNEEQSKVDDIRAYVRQIDDIDLEITTMTARKKLLENQLLGLDPMIAVLSETRRSDRLAVLERQLQTLLLTYTENYPEVLRLKAEIETLRNRQETTEEAADESTAMEGANPVYQETMQAKLALEAEISSLQARRTKLQQMVAGRESELREFPEKNKELDRLIQERDSARSIYEQLLQRLGQSEVSKQMEIGDKTTTFRIVDPAILPKVPVAPNMIKLILMSVAVGLGCGLGLVVLLEKMDGTIKDPEEIQELSVPVLAQIPTIVDQQLVTRRKKQDLALYLVSASYGMMVFSLLVYESIFRWKG
ncbi:MAG: GNVR domain-containing protein [Syntrophotaleaceae bacterium]